jgi:uncharacterized protein (TIGR03435 family)
VSQRFRLQVRRMNVRLSILLALGFVQAWTVGGQTPDSGLTFEVASVKPSAPEEAGWYSMTKVDGGPGTSDPGQVTYSNISLMNLLGRAYEVNSYQVSGPPWLDAPDTRYDIAAKIPPGTTPEQFKVMLRNLLADRFRMTLHHESRELPVYELVAGKNGPKFKASAASQSPTGAPALAPGESPKIDQNGFPQLDRPGMVTMMTTDHKARLTAKAQPISRLVSLLSGQLHSPVVDKTGLQGTYDFMLEYAPDGGLGRAADGQNDSLPNLVTVVQEQLGLKLEQKKAPLDFLVIDHVERVPTEN